MPKPQLNERGALTLDFIFAIVLVTGISGIFMALSLSFVVVELSQYIAFASSRVYFGAHLSEPRQAELAEQKFKELKESRSFRSLFRSGWFDLTKVQQYDFRDEYSDQKDRSTFVGVRLVFDAKALEFNVPFFGSTAPEGQSFKANINSFLGREPSFEECMEFVRLRYQNIIRLDSRYSSAGRPEDYAVHTDNGC